MIKSIALLLPSTLALHNGNTVTSSGWEVVSEKENDCGPCDGTGGKPQDPQDGLRKHEDDEGSKHHEKEHHHHKKDDVITPLKSKRPPTSSLVMMSS